MNKVFNDNLKSDKSILQLLLKIFEITFAPHQKMNQLFQPMLNKKL